MGRDCYIETNGRWIRQCPGKGAAVSEPRTNNDLAYCSTEFDGFDARGVEGVVIRPRQAARSLRQNGRQSFAGRVILLRLPSRKLGGRPPPGYSQAPDWIAHRAARSGPKDRVVWSRPFLGTSSTSATGLSKMVVSPPSPAFVGGPAMKVRPASCLVTGWYTTASRGSLEKTMANSSVFSSYPQAA